MAKIIVPESVEAPQAAAEPEVADRVEITFATDGRRCDTCEHWKQGMAWRGNQRMPVMLCGRFTVNPPPTLPSATCCRYGHKTGRIA